MHSASNSARSKDFLEGKYIYLASVETHLTVGKRLFQNNYDPVPVAYFHFYIVRYFRPQYALLVISRVLSKHFTFSSFLFFQF